MTWKREDLCGVLNRDYLGKKVAVAGWVKTSRDHGGLIFIDLTDRSGVVQLRFDPEVNQSTHSRAHSVRDGWVIAAEGRVVLRPPESVNPKIATGEVEIEVHEVSILNTSDPLPFSLEDDVETSEEVKLRYRYLDLRRPLMQKNMRLRYDVAKLVRELLDKESFIEIETPFLTRSTPEGARDYLVPSRVNPGEFYALPQSPQLFKQILMVAGFERYFQIVRCFRDEDLRADRQPEHTQIDVEMSFVEEEDVFTLVEGMLATVFEKTRGLQITRPFRRMTYAEALDKYGSDKPDIRFGMELEDLSFLGTDSNFEIFRRIVRSGGVIKGICLPGGATLSRKALDDLRDWATERGVGGLAWILFDKEPRSPIAKFLSPALMKQAGEQAGAHQGDAVFLVGGEQATVCEFLGQLRVHLACVHKLVKKDTFGFVWVVDFPLFERDSNGNLSPVHHPFTSPREEDIELLDANPDQVMARAYDIVVNGEEVGGGSIRIHRRNLEEKVLELLGIGDAEARDKFGFLLDALSYGAPPHGGIAIGLDRLVMLLAGESSLRNVIAFPKTQKAICLLTQAPSSVYKYQLDELHIKIE